MAYQGLQQLVIDQALIRIFKGAQCGLTVLLTCMSMAERIDAACAMPYYLWCPSLLFVAAVVMLTQDSANLLG